MEFEGSLMPKILDLLEADAFFQKGINHKIIVSPVVGY